jgi:acyl carrier protein
MQALEGVTHMKQQIIEAIHSVIDDYNRQNPKQKPVTKTPETALYGSKSEIDSLGLINLVVGVEQNIEQSFDRTITLADDRALSQEVSPFSTICTLADYIEVLLKEQA